MQHIRRLVSSLADEFEPRLAVRAHDAEEMVMVVMSQDEIRERLMWASEAMDVEWWRLKGWAVADEEVLAAASAAQVLIDAGLADNRLAGALEDAITAWRDAPWAFDVTLGSLARRADLATALSGWVDDEDGRPLPVPPHHWWWRLSKDW